MEGAEDYSVLELIANALGCIVCSPGLRLLSGVVVEVFLGVFLDEVADSSGVCFYSSSNGNVWKGIHLILSFEAVSFYFFKYFKTMPIWPKW